MVVCSSLICVNGKYDAFWVSVALPLELDYLRSSKTVVPEF